MKCAVEHCQSVARAKSLCNKHYQRAAKGEDPNAVLVYDLSPAERLAAKTSKTATCWLWTGRRNSDGYGRLRVNGKSMRAHRFALSLSLGREVSGLVLHSCDTPACVNPEHLREGTVRENAQDASRRGRLLVGLRNPRGKLSDADVAAIRRSSGPASVLAKKFGVSKTHIQRIRTGRARVGVSDV